MAIDSCAPVSGCRLGVSGVVPDRLGPPFVLIVLALDHVGLANIVCRRRTEPPAKSYRVGGEDPCVPILYGRKGVGVGHIGGQPQRQ